ncbi:hypothetical protein [Deinococcus sp. AJ005]|uniref:hypothetical protein n=1 Tax=Deinococcus sp. AJ005 TaxID=2652443 RepID=UPI00125CB530|nr:hypothetical protein [Deinococcus sp. AJ005]QFP75179.1 hypothetical protein DAAJ005_01070 [Deinococcus sp. AJ005]
MVDPADERATKLEQAFHTFNLEQIIGMLREELHRPIPQLRANLRPIFEAAQTQEMNLLLPPADFHDWLQTPLRQIQTGGEARANTIRARYATLKQLYDALIDLGVMDNNPAHGCPLPPPEHSQAPLPSTADIQRLLAEAGGTDEELFAALTLIYQQAFQLTELLALRWSALDFSRAELMRARTITALRAESLAALKPLLSRAGGPLHAPQKAQRVFSFKNADDVRLQLWKVCQAANLTPTIGPRELRLASLRDFPQAPPGSGFSNPQAYERALRHATTLTELKRSK